MANFSIIPKSQLEGAHRLDAEYYQPKYLEVFQKLLGLKTIILGDFCRIADGDHSKIPGFVENDGVRYLRAKDLQNFFIDDSAPVFVSKSYFQKIKRSHIKPLDIILSIMGTVDNLAVVPSDYRVITANRAVSIISPKSQDLISSYFLAVFLESKFGVMQRERESMGGVQQRINLDDLEKIKIPILPKSSQQIVEDMFEEASQQYMSSKLFYQQAEDLLLEELGLKDFQVQDDLSFVVNLSDVKSANRVDAEYFQPRYKDLLEKIRQKYKIRNLEEIAMIKRGALIDPVFYDETHGTPYIRGKDFSVGRLEKSDLIFINNKFLAKNETRLKEGDIVFASIGSVGTLALVQYEFNGSFISNNTGKISIKDKSEILPEYLTIVLHSIIGKFQFEKESSQTAQPKISDTQVKNFCIPVLPKPTQEEIAELVRKSHEARKKSKELLEEAKRKVEEMIENG